MNESITDLTSLLAAVRDGARPRYLFFWGHRPSHDGQIVRSCLSQWWPVSFAIDGVTYASAEHFMMAEKARLFGDVEARAAILAARTPAEAKKLGAEVRGFDEARWEASRLEIVTVGNVAKFAQNPVLGRFLAGTGEQVLVEASPLDRVWGIGLSADDARADDPQQWQGLNLLGFALMETRRRLAPDSPTEDSP